MKNTGIFILMLLGCMRVAAQGTFSGDFMTNVNFFDRDPNIKASGNPLYDNLLSGNEAWMDLRYSTKGFTFFVRADAFDNSNLKSPTSPSTDFGIGAWSISKDFKDLNITVGTIYDQIGSGILFRAYEDRGLLIDNGLVGIRLKYKFSDHFQIKAFSGQQRNNSVIGVNGAVRTPPYGPVIKGLNGEGDFNIGKVHLAPGFGLLNRTLDNASYTTLSQNIQSEYAGNPSAGFTPVYNMYAGTVYNMLTYKNFSWYVEGAYKSKEAIDSQTTILNKAGNVEYTSLNIGKKGIALSLTGKRTEYFAMRTSPNEILLNGMLNWQPIVAVLRPERLMARYTPQSQDLSEMAGTANLVLTPSDVHTINLTYTHINDLNNLELYREGYGEFQYLGFKSWGINFGAQYLEYNIAAYQTRLPLGAPIVYAITPFTEITYHISDKKSIRAELSYMSTKQDYGSWLFALLEYNLAPKWSLALSDMYNAGINKNPDNPNYSDPNFSSEKANHYYSIFTAYTRGANRFTIAYVKQVDGINCSGGVCRYEPAFSGVKATITSSF